MRFRASLAALLVAAVAATGCTNKDETALRRVPSGADPVFIDGWHGDEEGDQATVEQKPDGSWVLDTEAHYRTERTGDFDVEVRRTNTGFVEDMGDTLVGKDHDDCLEPGEHLAEMADETHEFERDVANPDTSNDDCETGSDDS